MASKYDLSFAFPKHALSAAMSAVFAGVPLATQAQDATDEATDDPLLEEVLVTATKREANLQDIPMSITAFTNEEIVRQGFKQLDDYAGQIPSLSFGRREPGGTNVIMRGCAVSGIAFSDNPTTAVYLDEQPITVAGFNPDPRLVDVQRVEALSGPQGSLFGDASQCGTLRIITNKPDTSEFESWVDLTAETVEHGDTGYDVSAMVNIPLVKDKVALRLVGFAAEEAGYVDNIFSLSPGGEIAPGGTFDNAEFVEDDVNSTDVTGARVNLRFTPNDDWTIDAGAIFQNVEADGFGDTDLAENFFIGRPLGEWEQIRFGEDLWEDEWYQLALTLEGDLGWGNLTVATSFMNRETRYDADSTAYLTGWQERYPYLAIYDFPDADPQAMSFDVGDSDRTSIEIRLASPGGSDSRWSGIIGAFYNEVENHTQFAANVRDLPESGFAYTDEPPYYSCGAHCYLNYVAFYYNCDSETGNDCIYAVAPSENWWTGVYDSKLEQVALFGEATFDITDNFSVTVGGRWFDIDTDRNLANGTLASGVTDFRKIGDELNCTGSTGSLCYTNNPASSSESDFVPKVNLTYSFDDKRMVYFTYSEGFRRGGGNAARPRSIFGRPPFNQFESDTVENFEIGAKTESNNGKFRFNITGYHMVWDNIQVEAEDPTPNLFTLGIINFPEAEINGLEIFADWVPNRNFQLTANIGYNDAELSEGGALAIEGVEIERSAVKGTPLPLVPDWKANLSARYSFDGELFNAKPSLHFDWQHTGDSVNSLAGIQSIEFNNPVRNQDAYDILNLRFSLDGDDWSTSLYVNNVTDEYAKQFYNDRWAQTRLSVNRPRSIGINYRKYWK